jgi:transposase
LLPPSWDEKIPLNHPVRVVSSVIDSLDLSKLYKSYEGGGTSGYHPKMLLKVILFTYINNIYSSRKIEEAIKSNREYARKNIPLQQSIFTIMKHKTTISAQWGNR